MSTHPFLNIATKAAIKAGQMMLQARDRLDKLVIHEKQPADYVTEVDIRSEHILIEAIQKAFPDHAIVAEENGQLGDPTLAEYTWYIDPLDGTRNFIQGLPHFAISMAIVTKNRIEHGLVFAPVLQELFIASRGVGARMNERRLRVSPCNHLSSAVLTTGIPSRNHEAIEAYLPGLEKLAKEGASIRRLGAASLDLAYVAMGRLEGYWEYGLKPWDIAAGILLVREAGGLCSTPMNDETMLSCGHIVAGNPKIVKAILQALQ